MNRNQESYRASEVCKRRKYRAGRNSTALYQLDPTQSEDSRTNSRVADRAHTHSLYFAHSARDHWIVEVDVESEQYDGMLARHMVSFGGSSLVCVAAVRGTCVFFLVSIEAQLASADAAADLPIEHLAGAIVSCGYRQNEVEKHSRAN